MKQLLLLVTMMMLSMGAQAGNVLYAEIDGTSMTLKCGDSAPETSDVYIATFHGHMEWNESYQRTITSVTIDASCQNYTGTTLAWLFGYCWKLKTITDLSNLNTANVSDMSSMFAACNNLTSIDLSGFNTEKVTDLGGMFTGCSSLTSLDLSGFNTSNVTNISGMFRGCSSLTSLDLSGFNTANVKHMIEMFFACHSLISLDLSSFNTANVSGMSGMFGECYALSSLNLSGWNTANVSDMGLLFSDCTSLTSLDLSSFNTTNVTQMGAMFWNCSSLKTIYVSNWDNGNLITGGSNDMFYDCLNLVGGAGTAWSAENANDYTFACIDGGPEAPGYFTDIKASGIKGLTIDKAEKNAPIYDLNGQQLSEPRKGINVIGGKKVLVK